VPLTAPAGPGQRVHCPRCEEVFLVRGAADQGAVNGPQSSDVPAGFAEPAPRRWSNRSVAAAILGVMALMALIGFSWAWVTTESRRKRDHLSPPEGPVTVRTVVIAPSRLAGLAYLPADVNILAGLHIAEILAEPSGRELFLPSREAAGASRLDSLAQWTGLALDEIDHAVLGVRTEERLIPRITLVVETRRPYDADRVRAALKVGRSSERGKRTLYRFTPAGSSLELTLWFAGPRTLVLGLIPEDFDEVPATPTPGADRFAEPLRQILVNRTSEGTQAWACAHVRDWQHALALQAVPGFPALHFHDEDPTEHPLLTKVQTLGAWLQLGGAVTANLAIGCTDGAAADQLANALRRTGEESLLPWAVSTLPWKWQTEEGWITGRAEADAAAFRRALASPQD
jgi:hypothetical protein